MPTNVEFNSDDKTKSYILSLFNKEVSPDGKVIDSQTREVVLSVDGREVTLEKLWRCGISRQSTNFYYQ